MPEPGSVGTDYDGPCPPFFDARRVAKYKFPEYLVVVPELPRTASGKVRKFELKRDIIARLSKGMASD